MKFHIRNTSVKDIEFYRHCFDNVEFLWNLYGNDNVNLDKYVSDEEKHIKYIVSKVNCDKIEDVGFCHFYYDAALNEYDFVGGIVPKIFNSGIGLFASVAILSYLFSTNSNIILKSGVFKYNKRSIKMQSKLGFVLIEVTNEKIIFRNTFSQFHNDFVEWILKRIEISYM
jgi:RimJ/RimL family protein N-acetyltransferase